ncbi:hypothetical protein CDD81_5513 [Ophiocordyceps australis]|uniref:Uncharacterized protein n=1 Tax=Ophiocordyceps australis TaxID=1399860 RepID=A0A2C5XIE0_9HYPO|nr:hypothetical protein CDD81_5513 [Ophiocordyceps australis]
MCPLEPPSSTIQPFRTLIAVAHLYAQRQPTDILCIELRALRHATALQLGKFTEFRSVYQWPSDKLRAPQSCRPPLACLPPGPQRSESRMAARYP